MSQLVQKDRFQIHDYYRAINSITKPSTELSSNNSELILKYDGIMAREFLAKDI